MYTCARKAVIFTYLEHREYLVQMVVEIVAHKRPQDAIPTRLIEAKLQVLGA